MMERVQNELVDQFGMFGASLEGERDELRRSGKSVDVPEAVSE